MINHHRVITKFIQIDSKILSYPKEADIRHKLKR